MSEKVTFDAAISTAFLQLQQQTLSAIPDLALLSAAFSPSPTLINKTDAIIYMAERKQKRTISYCPLEKEVCTIGAFGNITHFDFT